MKYKITVQTFFRNETGVEFVKNGELYKMNNEQFECWVRQAKLMGFRVMCDNKTYVSLSRTEKEIEIFLKELK